MEEKMICVDIEFNSEPVLTVTKQAYEQVMKSLDNIALPNQNQVAKVESTTSTEIDEKENSNFKAIHACLKLHSLRLVFTRLLSLLSDWLILLMRALLSWH